MNATLSEKNQIDKNKTLICIGFFLILFALPLFLFVAFIKDVQPGIELMSFASLTVFRYFGKAFNEEIIAYYLACGYGALISFSILANYLV